MNIGAGKIDRVKETIRILTRYVLIVGTTAFLIFELVPDASYDALGAIDIRRDGSVFLRLVRAGRNKKTRCWNDGMNSNYRVTAADVL